MDSTITLTNFLSEAWKYKLRVRGWFPAGPFPKFGDATVANLPIRLVRAMVEPRVDALECQKAVEIDGIDEMTLPPLQGESYKLEHWSDGM